MGELTKWFEDVARVIVLATNIDGFLENIADVAGPHAMAIAKATDVVMPDADAMKKACVATVALMTVESMAGHTESVLSSAIRLDRHLRSVMN